MILRIRKASLISFYTTDAQVINSGDVLTLLGLNLQFSEPMFMKQGDALPENVPQHYLHSNLT